ncbi:LADA_0C02410g1_1 [Lachancea dasiensis]|uniref:LADA_0C02410g1_1 n=1 Tax=Lachancea dasiensis TaxID=1072105 RepID=A0A1G4IXY7_9SACH|nr:LADA_0C02410g1_1 [Lachancea dasiensis]
MNHTVLKGLQQRDVIEKNFIELFPEAIIVSDLDDQNDAELRLKALKKELELRDRQIEDYNATLRLKNKDAERLNDEIISLTIENNLLQERYDKMKAEHDHIVARWLHKAQQEADSMNERLR